MSDVPGLELSHDGAWTEDAFLALETAGRRIELIDGSLLVGPTADDPHARAVAAVRAAVQAVLPEGLEITGPVALRLSPGRILVPDLVVATRSEDSSEDVRDSSVALIVIDVVGQGHGVADRWFKPQLYAGSRIPYALLVDHDDPFAVASMLIGGRYHEYAAAEGYGVLRLEEPFALDLDLADLTTPAIPPPPTSSASGAASDGAASDGADGSGADSESATDVAEAATDVSVAGEPEVGESTSAATGVREDGAGESGRRDGGSDPDHPDGDGTSLTDGLSRDGGPGHGAAGGPDGKDAGDPDLDYGHAGSPDGEDAGDPDPDHPGNPDPDHPGDGDLDHRDAGDPEQGNAGGLDLGDDAGSPDGGAPEYIGSRNAGSGEREPGLGDPGDGADDSGPAEAVPGNGVGPRHLLNGSSTADTPPPHPDEDHSVHA